MNLQSAKERLGSKFANVVELSSGVLRSVRRSGESSVAAYVFDFNDRLSETAAHLTSYLDDVLGRSYFDESAPPDLRWNHYLYFVVPKASNTNDQFRAAKRKVEADRSYARKYVIYEEELDKALNELDSVATAGGEVATGDVMQAWAEKLGAAGLESVLDLERAIADIVRVAASTAPKKTVRKLRTSNEEAGRLLASGALASVDLTSFREYPRRRQFDRLGRANLIVGANGVGKTSLLEGIEFLFCGANRRSGVDVAGTVKATLASGASVSTASVQPLSDFKTRQRIWYGTNDASRRNTLANQFGRFNFLNTDAAAELALRVGDDGFGAKGNVDSLADLLSGHEATLLWRRIQAVLRAVADELRAKESERSVATAELRSKDTELKSLAAVPGRSDAAFAVLVKDLVRVGWRPTVSLKEQVSAQFVEELSELASRLGLAKQVDWTARPLSAEWPAKETERLTTALESLRQSQRTLQSEERKRQSIQSQLKAETTRRDALASIDPAAAASLQMHASEVTRLNAEGAAAAKVRAALSTDDAFEVEDEWKQLPVAVAVSALSPRLAASRKQVTELESRLREVVASQTRLQETLSQLRVLALQSIEHLHSDSACPVCGTRFEAGQLLARMEGLASSQSESQALDLRRRLEAARAELDSLTSQSARLEELARFALASEERQDAVTVADARQHMANFLERQRERSREEQTHRQAISRFRRSGLTLERLTELCGPASVGTQASDAVADVTLALAQVRERVDKLNVDLGRADAAVSEVREVLIRLMEGAGVDADVSLSRAIEVLTSRRSLAMSLDEACLAASNHISLTPETDIRALLTSLEAAVLSAQSVLAASQVESTNADRKKLLEQQVEQLKSRRTRLAHAVERLGLASKALGDIVKNNSLEQATKLAVEATHRVADAIFGRIHAPTEYRVTTDTAAPLARREGGNPVTLNEVSTGQRAAYALSMFLAMNAQVRSGPQVVLLDDPISHIDDLNALSFLDYLRNLVLQSSRQVFFATADEKMAGLFSHKFAFLGDDFRTFELTRA